MNAKFLSMAYDRCMTCFIGIFRWLADSHRISDWKLQKFSKSTALHGVLCTTLPNFTKLSMTEGRFLGDSSYLSRRMYRAFDCWAYSPTISFAWKRVVQADYERQTATFTETRSLACYPIRDVQRYIAAEFLGDNTDNWLKSDWRVMKRTLYKVTFQTPCSNAVIA